MNCLHGKDFGYPLMDLAEAYVYRAAFCVDWERHAVWEIHHVLSGMVVYEFDGGKSAELQGGTFLAIPPRIRHRTMNGSAAPSMRLAMRWCPNTPGRHSKQNPLFLSRREISSIFAGLTEIKLRPRTMSAAMLRSAKDLFSAIGEACDLSDPLANARLRHMCNDMLLNLALVNGSPEPIPKGSDTVAAIKAHIEANLDKKLRISNLMRISGYGSTQLNKLFRDKTGTTPNGYLIRARIAKARQLIETSAMPLAEIALTCGFPSASYFSTVYAKYSGISPSHSRRKKPHLFSTPRVR